MRDLQFFFCPTRRNLARLKSEVPFASPMCEAPKVPVPLLLFSPVERNKISAGQVCAQICDADALSPDIARPTSLGGQRCLGQNRLARCEGNLCHDQNQDRMTNLHGHHSFVAILDPIHARRILERVVAFLALFY